MSSVLAGPLLFPSSGLNGNRSDPAAVASDGDQQLAVDVETLCCAVEAMFLHELKNSKVR